MGFFLKGFEAVLLSNIFSDSLAGKSGRNQTLVASSEVADLLQQCPAHGSGAGELLINCETVNFFY